MKTNFKTICVIGSIAIVVASLGGLLFWRVMTRPTNDQPSSRLDIAQSGVFEKIRSDIRDDREILFATDQNGLTLLHSAAEKNQVDVVNLLVAAGAIVDARDKLARTPLFLAASVGAEDVVKVLVNLGADCNARFQLPAPAETPFEIDRNLLEGDSVLEAAAKGKHHQVVKLLLDHGAVAQASDRTHRRSALHAACDASVAPDDRADPANADNHLVIDMLARQVDWNSENAAGETPLHLAVSRGNVAMTRYILSSYDTINLELQDFNGDTPLHRVLRNEEVPAEDVVAIVELLLRHGAKSDITNNHGLTPLGMASQLNKSRLVQLLSESP